MPVNCYLFVFVADSEIAVSVEENTVSNSVAVSTLNYRLDVQGAAASQEIDLIDADVRRDDSVGGVVNDRCNSGDFISPGVLSVNC